MGRQAAVDFMRADRADWMKQYRGRLIDKTVGYLMVEADGDLDLDQAIALAEEAFEVMTNE